MRISFRRIALSLFLLFSGTLFTACVSTSAYEDMKEDYQDRLEARNNTIDSLKQQNESLNDRIARLQSENENLKAKLEIAESARLSQEEIGIIGEEAGFSRGEHGQIVIEGDLLFDSGSWDIKDDAKGALSDLASSMQNKNVTLKIAGHTDNEPINNIAPKLKFDINMELGALRALSVFDFLKDQGLNPEHMYIASYGQYRPQKPNTSPENMAKNRRVEIWQFKGKEPGGSTSGNDTSQKGDTSQNGSSGNGSPQKGGK